ncbi:endonuclease domain-containing protein [Dialister sp.]|uniref:endonuclease domain-containing protein n=1 Tax=Dialister sp. TaxID=1955814 RepID=UPI002E811F36|nr:endonuclease domain-containing protein [Dialister sp.]MEE3453756.1 endonuclease domain-containing protein [Dialister sp.]
MADTEVTDIIRQEKIDEDLETNQDDDEEMQRLKALRYQLKLNATEEERLLWRDYLSKGRGQGIRFVRQKIIRPYIVDFYCPLVRLVIELDGSQHFSDHGKAYDEKRTAFLQSKGYMVIRYSNLQVHENFYGVCQDIERIVRNRIGK